MLIAFEGPDGCGKTELMARTSALLVGRGPVTVTREPGGTNLGLRIRELVLDGRQHASSRTLLLLYMANRSEHTEQVLLPSIGAGDTVMVDRFFASTLVYQAAIGQLSYAKVIATHEMATSSVQFPNGIFPDVTVFVDTPVEDIARFKAMRNLPPDRFDSIQGRTLRMAYIRVLTDPELDQYHGELIIAENGVDVDLDVLAEETARRILDVMP